MEPILKSRSVEDSDNLEFMYSYYQLPDRIESLSLSALPKETLSGILFGKESPSRQDIEDLVNVFSREIPAQLVNLDRPTKPLRERTLLEKGQLNAHRKVLEERFNEGLTPVKDSLLKLFNLDNSESS
jgi:hypothetical protein